MHKHHMFAFSDIYIYLAYTYTYINENEVVYMCVYVSTLPMNDVSCVLLGLQRV